MRKWLIGAVCAALVSAAPKYALSFGDGSWLLENGTSDETMISYAYLHYVVGVSDGYLLALLALDIPPTYCVGEPYGITNGDMGDAVRLWLRRDPVRLKFTASLVIVSALTEYFPCETGDS